MHLQMGVGVGDTVENPDVVGEKCFVWLCDVQNQSATEHLGYEPKRQPAKFI